MASETWNTHIFRLPFPVLCGLVVGLLCINSVTSRSPCDPRRQFSCRNHPSVCIPKSQVYDGVVNCPDASDEECPSTMHQCLCGKPRCIERRLVGDGILHCLDGSDEGEVDTNYVCPESGHTESVNGPGTVPPTADGSNEKSRSKRQTTPRRDQVVYPTGIISAFTGTEVKDGRTTLHRTEIYRTYLDGSYAQVLHSTSSVLPTATNDHRNQDDSQTAYLGLANKAEIFGSLTSGKVYLTAVSEPVSSLSSTVLPVPHTENIYRSSISTSLGNNEVISEDRENEFSSFPFTTITGSIVPHSGELVTKHLILDVSAKTVGTSYPQNSESSGISVTGTQGHFIHRDASGDKTYSIFTGSYVSGSEHPTTYVFFFGNSPLTSEVRVVLPTKTSDALLRTIHQDNGKWSMEELKESASAESNKIETKFPGLRFEASDNDDKGGQVTDILSRRTRRDEDEVINRLRYGDTFSADDATPIYDNEQPFNANVFDSQKRNPIAITRYIQPTSSREKSAYILISTSENGKAKTGTAQALTLRGHPKRSRHGRMYQPTSVAGRRVQGTGSATIITDQFFLPGATNVPYGESSDLNDEAFYEDAAIRVRGQDLNEEFRKLGGLGRFIIPSKSLFTDKRITKTVGLYGPIYDIDYDTNKEESPAHTNGNSTKETAVYHSKDKEENSEDPSADKTITLFGFAEFSTEISGTNYIFMPASTLPRTFTPRVTRTNFFRGTAGSSTKSSLQPEADVFFRQPLYGTETREFVSQMSMFTSTVKDPIELQKTMVTVTVATKQMEERSRIAKLGEDAVLPEIPLSTRPITFSAESQSDKLYSINIENLKRSNVFPDKSMELDVTEIVDDVQEPKDNAIHLQPTGLLSSITGKEVGNGMTTHWTTLIFGTYVDDTYAHIIQSTSSIFYTITKTATPDGTFYETSEAGDGLHDSAEKSEFIDVHASFYDTPMDKLSPSLNDISSFSTVSFEPTEDLSATSAIQILTSGFFLPQGDNHHDVSESLTATEHFLNTENRQVEKQQKPAHANSRQTESDLISPSVLYESDSHSEDAENAAVTQNNRDPKHSTTVSLQILTEGFILPTLHKNSVDLSLSKRNVSVTYRNPSHNSDSDESSYTDSTLNAVKENAELSLEDYINSRNGVAAEDRDEVRNDSHTAPENSVLNSSSEILPLNFIDTAYSNSTNNDTEAIAFDTLSEHIKDKISGTLNLEDTSFTIKSKNASAHPTAIHAYDSDVQLSSPSVVLLTGDFILPRQPVNEKENKKDEEIHAPDNHLRPSILTDGFILPEGQEKSPKTNSENQNVTSSKTSPNIYSTAPLSILTAGFILPGKMPNNKNSETQNNLPSSELLTADFFLPTNEDVVTEKNGDASAAEARSAGSASSYIITDRFILPTPVNIPSKSNVEDSVNNPEDETLNGKINGNSIDVSNLAAEEITLSSSIPRLGKAIKISNENHGDASRVEELLPSISYPITYYTTSTYFTTFLLEGSTVVSSREETISQVYTDSDHFHQAQIKSANLENQEGMTGLIRPSKSQDFYTDYTTITYYKTLLQNGSIVVTSTEEIKSRTINAAETPSLPSKTMYPVSTYPTTYYTTLTYFTTLLRDGSTDIITSKTVMSNVVPTADDIRKVTATSYPKQRPDDSTKTGSKPTTYYTTYTYYTTFLRDGETSVNTRLHTVSNVAYGTNPSTSTHQITNSLQPTTSSSIHEDLKTKPTTYFTTYTYYTTYLRNDKTVISSREEVISNVIGAQTTSPSKTVSTSLYSTKSPSPVKTTFYTTYTYYTTFLRNGTTTVSAREETVTNIKYDHTSDITSTRTGQVSFSITPTPVVTTYYTTYTYFTTFLRNGSAVVSSRESTVENVVIQTSHSSDIPSSSSIAPTRVFSTYYTTLTSYFTLSKEGSASVSTVFSTLTDVVALSTPDIRSSVEHVRTTVKLPPVTTTYTTVFTYYTTHFSNGAPVVSSREETRTNVVILPTAKTKSDRLTTIVHAVTPLTSLHRKDNSATLTPTNVIKTYYTTYSYFTTFLKDGQPSVSTRLETIKSFETSAHDLQIKLSKQVDKMLTSTRDNPVPSLFGSLSTVTSNVVGTLFSPVTHYTTYTYYTTQLKDGVPIVNSRTEVLSSVVSNTIENKQTAKHVFSTDLLRDQYIVSTSDPQEKSNAATINPSAGLVVNETKAKTDLDAAEGEFLEKRVQPNVAVTYFSTHTYLTTSIEANGHTQLVTKKVTASAVISPEAGAKNENTVISVPQQPNSLPVLSSSLTDCCNENSNKYHKHTVYTTYTFYTTSYDGDTPVVTSRFDIITNVIDQKGVKTLLEINPTKTVGTAYFSSFEPRNISDKTHESTSTGKISHSGQGPHVRLIQEGDYNLHSATLHDTLLSTMMAAENVKSENDSQESKETVSSESITNATDEGGEEKKGRSQDNSESRTELRTESTSTVLNRDNENATSSRVKSLFLETDKKALLTTVSSITSADRSTAENSETTLDSDGYSPNTSEVTTATDSVLKLTRSTSLNENTTDNEIYEETTNATTADEKAFSEVLTTTTEVPRRGIFSRRNRPSYRPRPTTRLTSLSPTTSSTTTSPRTSAPFGRRNTSRLLFRRTNPANRTFPLRRLRISKPSEKANESHSESLKEAGVGRKKRSSSYSEDEDYEVFPNLRKLLNARDEDAAIKNNDLVYPYSKHDHGGIVIRSAYEENSSPRDYRISPIQNSNDLYPTGLIRSLEAKAVNNGVTTVYATEIHGTYINGAYAQVVHSSTKVLSDTSNEIERTSLIMPSVPVQISTSTKEYSSTVNHQKVGLVSSDINTSVRDGKTTIYTTHIYGTYVGDVYAHIAQTFSSVVTPTSPLPNQYSTGLISSTLRSEMHEGSTTVWTTHIYGTFVNGYYAHIASTISNIYGQQTKKVAQPTLLPSGFNNHIYAHATPDTDFRSSNVQHQPRRIDQDKMHPKQEHKVGLLSSFVSNFVRDGTTTEYITNIYGTFVGQQYAQHMQTTSRIILPKQTETPTRSVGLLSTMVNSVVNENRATIYKTEIYGTYIGQHYAQIARTSTETRVLPTKTTKTATTSTQLQRTGLITTSIIRSEVVRGTTTLHLNEIYGTYIGNAYAHVAKSTTRVIQNTMGTQSIPSSSQNEGDNGSQKTGLVSSKVSTEINDGTTTLHISEIHGTYIGSYYAHIARRTSTVLPFITPSSTATLTTSQVEGIISSVVSTEINYGTTTLHTREIYGTTINGFSAHVARSTSNVITPTPSSVQSKTAFSGLVSVITNSEINGGILTLYTTEIFGTTINGFYAHVARSSSLIIPATSSEQPAQTNGLISVINSTEISNGMSILHETSLIGSDVNGYYVQAVKSTSHMIYGSKPFEEHSTKASVPEVDVRQTLPVNGDRDFLDTARVNQVDSDNQHGHFSASKNRNLATPASLPSYYDILSPSFNSDNVLDVESSQTATPNIPLQLRTQSDSSYKELVSTLSYLPFLTESLSIHETIDKALRDKISSFQTSSASEESTDDNNTTPMEDENEDDYNDYCEDEKTCKFKETRTTKPNRGDTEEKRRVSTRPPPKKLRSENDYDDYDYDQDYEEFEKKKEKEISKHLPNITPSRDRISRTSNLRNSQQDHRKATKTPFQDKDYDDYEDEYDDEESSYQTSTESSESQSTKEQQTNSVRIRPFAGRGRPTFTTPLRTTTKPSFTIQFRRPSRVRNSRAFGQRSDSENNHDFDDELENEDEEGDIEASEAVVTSATPQVLPFRRKTFGNQRFQPLTRSSTSSTTTARPPPLILNRNRRLFGRSFSSSPSPTTSLKDNVSDYVENTTEDDEFDNYDDIEEKDEGNGNQRGPRLTRRPSSRFSRTYGERRSPSIKRGTVRQREDEEVENDDIDSTTPDYRSSRNHRYQRKQNRNRLNQNRSPSLKTSFNSVSRDEDEDPHSLQPLNRLRSNTRRRQSYNPRTRRPTKTATETQTTVKKPHLTVTSVVTTVKTLPIYHGFRTSYATLTTTALDTSIINPSQYSTVVNDGLTKTLVFSKVGLPDGIENFYTTITEVVITTTSLASVKLVPIKIGFSTRTDTVTDIQVLTTLSTMYSTISSDTPTPTAFPQQFQPPPFFPHIGPQNQDFGLFNSPNSFVTTQVVTSTTVIPVVLRGRTILSTLTTTSTSESTVVQNANIRVPQVPSAAPFIPQPYFAFQPITTQITLYVTGEYGELKPVVTTVTVPLYQQPVFHTKVARSLQSAPTEQPIISTELPKLVLKTSMNDDGPGYLEIDTHYDKLLSSGLEEINDISEIMNSRAKTDPLESTALSPDTDNYNSADVTTILKGPLTEIYEQKATMNIDLHSVHNGIEHPANRASEKFGIESSYNFRKLQQFTEEDEEDIRPQHEFTRLRRPPSEITRSPVVNNIPAGSRSPETLFSRRQPQINAPRRQPSVQVFTERTTGDGEPPRRESPAISRRLQRPSSNYRPFVRRPSSLLRDETDVRNLPSIEAQPSQPGLNDLDEINGLVDLSRVTTRESDLSNTFSGSPSLQEASRNGFRPLVSPPSSGNLNGDGPQSNLQVRPVRLRVVRPSYDSVTSKNTLVKRITKTRTINPTDASSHAVAENELETTSNLKPHENADVTHHKSEDGDIVPTATEDISLSSASVLKKDVSKSSHEDESSANSENSNDYAGYRRTVVRRLRPSFVPGDGRGARRPVVVRRTRFSTLVISESNSDDDVGTSTPIESPTFSEVSETLPLISNDPEELENEKQNGNLDPTVPSADTKPLRKVIRLRKPESAVPGQNHQRRRIVVTKRPSDKIESTGRTGSPLLFSKTPDNRHKYGFLTDDDVSLGNKVRDAEDSDYVSSTSLNDVTNQLNGIYPTKSLPFTYYTTLTYFTTFIRGSDIVYASREAVFSNIIHQTLNPSLISVIQNSNGHLSNTDEDKTVHLASRILGDTTTLVNLASKQNVYNSDIHKILKGNDRLKITATSALGERPSGSTISSANLLTTNIGAIASLPKTYVTLFTYFYTFYDGNDRRHSTRAETITNVAVDPTQFLSENIGTSINEFGYLPVGPSTTVVHLGSRDVEGTTTEVNLGLKTLVHFNGLRNLVLESDRFSAYITPTRTSTLPKTESSVVEDTLLPSFETSREGVLTSSLLQPSYVSANELFNSDATFNSGSATPIIPYSLDASDNNEVEKPREPFLRVTSVIHKPSGSLRSGVFTPRPGIRVRVKPVVSRRPDGNTLSSYLSPDYTDVVETTATEVIASDTNKLDFYNTILPIPVAETTYITAADDDDTSNLQDTGKENELTSEEEVPGEDDQAPSHLSGPTRKRLKITVRRPQSGSVSRTHTRFVLPSRFEITSKPRFYVVTRTGALGVVSPSQRPFTVKISRKVKSSATEEADAIGSTTVLYDTYTTLTTVPVIFGLETSFRNVLLTTSSPVTVTHVSASYEEETPGIQPSHTVVLTYFTTTTFTIPYTIGHQTLYTTLEQTNSRIVTTAFDGLDSLTYSTITRTTEATDEILVKPSHVAITSIEFGFGGPTTHILSSDPDGTRTMSVIYPPGQEGERATKVIITNPEGVELTSLYGHVSDGKDEMSLITIGTYEDLPSDSILSTTEPISSSVESTTVLYDTQTFFTTYTVFTTSFIGTDSFISSYEQVVSNVVTVPVTRSIIPTSSPHIVPELSSVPSIITVFDTSEYVTTTTSYNTVTFYATLFNDTMSFVTPIEEVQTETGVITETYTITKTIVPTPITESTFFLATPSSESESSVIITQTLYTTYTNYVTLFQGTDTVVSNLEEVVSNVVTLTVPASDASTLTLTSETPISTISETPEVIPTSHIPLYTTREVLSTQTHYLTIFNGDEKILSSLEEVVTSFVTEIDSPHIPSDTPELILNSSTDTPQVVSTELFTPFTTQLFSFEPTTIITTEEEMEEETETYQPELVPSIRTIYSTLTFYTTYFSDTSSIVATQEEVLTSYVTLFVPPSLITSTSTEDQTSTSTLETSSSISTEQVFIFTTTDYSTLTLYTTLFSGDETTVISSEQVIEEIITATITPSSSSSTLQSTPSAESVLTFLTTFTYYTTYFSGADAVIASSESVVTQFITIEAAPTVTSTVSSTDISTPVVPDETIIGVSVASGGDISSSFKDDIREGKIIGVVTAVSSSIATETEQPLFTETSVVSVVSSATRVDVETETRSDLDISSTIVETTVSETSLATEEHDLSDSVVGRSHEGRGLSTYDTLLGSTVLSATLSEDSDIVLFTEVSSSKTPDLPATSTSIVTETTEIIGTDGKITTLVPSATLMLVTGTDGLVTKLSETEVSVSSLSSSSTTINSTQSSSEIKPATVIELSDLLGGNTAFGGDIGLAIQDIVSLITGKKNKTDGESVLPETTTRDSITTDDDESKKHDTETVESSTGSTSLTESSTPIGTEGDTTKEEVPELGAKELDYPIFIPDTPKSYGPSTQSDIPTPVYIPSPKIESPEIELNFSRTSSTETNIETLSVTPDTSDDVIHDTRTSVITGIRTVFLQTITASSSSKEKELTSSSSIPDSSDELKSHTVSTKTESGTLLETVSVHKEVTHSPTPKLSTSVGTSIVTGVKTIFFETVSSLPEEITETVPSAKSIERPVESVLQGVTKLQPSSKSVHAVDSLPRGRANDEPSVLRSFTTVTKDGQTIVSRTTSGATTIFYPENLPKASSSTLSTRYITSVESITRTLALTTTRTYYTRDSTLTVPSVYTTTIPPRTFVSTLIGTRTILGILPEPTETIQIHQTSAPTERTTTVTTTTLIFNSIPSTVVRTLVLPTRIAPASTSSFSESTSEESVFSAGTEKPAKPPEVADSTSIGHPNSDRNDSSSVKTPFQKQRDETYLRAAGPRLRDYQFDIRAENEIARPPIVITEANTPEYPFTGEIGVCEPSCQPYKKEVCKETKEGRWTCQCRPGHARKEDYDVCSEVQTYVVLLKVLKMGNKTVNFSNTLADAKSEKFKEFTKAAKEGISEMYQYTSIRDHYLGSDVNAIIPVDKDAAENASPGEVKPSGVIVNFTVQVSPSVSKSLLEQELTRSLQLADQRVGASLLTMAPLSQSVRDFDECQDERYNDCSPNARCENTPGSYTCECSEGFEDMDSKLPGRTCLAKTENCEYCHGRGDCLEKEEGKIFCRCLPMFIGRRCEINGLVLAIALPTAVAVVVMLLCGVAFCCRRCRRKSTKTDSSGMFREIALRGPVGSTLDRKAMIDTSSESSGEHGIRNPQAFDGYQESGDVTPKKGSKKSDLSLDRSLSTGYTVPPVMIPRARQHQPHNKMNYAVYNGQVYVW